MPSLKFKGNLAIVFFVVFFLISIYDGGTQINRVIRLIPNVIAILLLAYYCDLKAHRRIFVFLLLLLASAIFAFWFESHFYRELAIIFNILAFIALGFVGISRVNKIKTSYFISIYFVVSLIVILAVLWQLTDLSRDKLTNNTQYILMIISNLSFVFAIGSALLNMHSNVNKKSIFFLSLVLVFILSEILRAASYFSDEKFGLFYYGCRLLYILGLAMVIYFCALQDKRKKMSLFS